jgi:hypothetical protein
MEWGIGRLVSTTRDGDMDGNGKVCQPAYLRGAMHLNHHVKQNKRELESDMIVCIDNDRLVH